MIFSSLYFIVLKFNLQYFIWGRKKLQIKKNTNIMDRYLLFSIFIYLIFALSFLTTILLFLEEELVFFIVFFIFFLIEKITLILFQNTLCFALCDILFCGFLVYKTHSFKEAERNKELDRILCFKLSP